MQWKKERDLLIAQTLAFVQSVAGKKTDAGSAETAPDVEATLIRAIEISAIESAEPAKATAVPTNLSRPMIASDFRSEMQARVANFRAHQERFHREREAYCDATLAKTRAALANGFAAAPSRE